MVDQPEWVYSTEALNVLDKFHEASYIVYVEGEDTYVRPRQAKAVIRKLREDGHKLRGVNCYYVGEGTGEDPPVIIF